MAIDQEKDREGELESAMYTNCLLLGLDPAIMAGWNSRVGHFRHSNPRLGEQLLYFILSSLRGPVQSAKDFDKVWPICDSSQSRDFRKIVQGIISELESKGALPRNNARISSLATCCGPRFVELLWQLSVHALREVHRRTFSSDVSSNPLPASLTDVSYQNATALLPVTKARVALERRKFLRNANIADQRQTGWANLANEMTAEFRELCAEEAYLQQELEKMQEMRNKANLDGELWDDRISSSSVQNSLLVSKATRLWESLLSQKSQHEVLASGPIEDLIAHREHRYRISGSSLAAAMELSGHVPKHSDLLSTRTNKKLSSTDIHEQRDSLQFQGKHDILSRTDDRVHHTVDVAEVLRRWTHALQRIHKHSLDMAKANDGEGPELFQSENGSDGHTESLVAALAEHRQHLVTLQGLVDQLKAAVPDVQESIAKLTEEVDVISPISLNQNREQSISPVEAQRNDNSSDTIIGTATNPSLRSERVSKHRALKLPHLFNISPNWSRKNTRETKPHDAVSVLEKSEASPPENSGEESEVFALNLRRAVREAALSCPSSNSEITGDKASSTGSEHFFVSLTDVPQKEVEAVGIPTKLHLMSSCSLEESLEQASSPLLLNDEPLFDDCYEDLLDPLSDMDTALMESSSWLQHNFATDSVQKRSAF